MKVRANGLSLPDLDTLAALETGRYWTPAKRPGEALYRPAINNGYWAEDILNNGLVLYVPLWLYSGAKFPSVDAYHHTCTVTGATWGAQGRLFNGTSDVINLGDKDVFSFGNGLTDSPLSIIVWLNCTNLDAFRLILCKTAAGAQEYGLHWLDATTLRFLIVDNSVGKQCVRTMTVQPSLATWVCLGITYSGVGGASAGNGITMYLNGALRASTATNDASYVAMENLTCNLKIGGRDQADYWFKGTIGEVLMYNRALSLAEMTHHYNVTRWRYA